MNKKNFFEAVRLCNKEAAKVISFYGAVSRCEEHLDLMCDIRSYSLSRMYSKDIEHGVTYDSLEKSRDGYLMGLMYAMFELNSAYKKATGRKANLVQHFDEANLEAAMSIFMDLQDIAL